MSEQLTFIPVSEAAEMVGVSAQTIRNLCKAKTLRYQMRGNMFYVCTEDLKKYADLISQVQQIEMDIEKYKAALKQEQKELTRTIEDAKERIKGVQVSTDQIKRVFQSIPPLLDHITLDLDPQISAQSMYILRQLFMGASPVELAEQFHLTLSRVYQIGNRVVKKMAQAKTLMEEKDEIIAELRAQVERLQEDLAQATDPIPEGLLKKAKFLVMPITSLHLSNRAEKVLKKNNVNYVLDLVQCNRKDILRMPNMGKRSIDGIDLFLEVNGLDYEMIIPQRATLSVLYEYAMHEEE